jgi:hypothetical protein
MNIQDILFNKNAIVIWVSIILSTIITIAFLLYPAYPYSCSLIMIQVILLPHLNARILLSKLKPVSKKQGWYIGILTGAITASIPTFPAFINTGFSVFSNIGKEKYFISLWNSRGAHIPIEFGNYPIITLIGIFMVIFWIVTILIGAFCGYLAGSIRIGELLEIRFRDNDDSRN